jgi:hypothetical protein
VSTGGWVTELLPGSSSRDSSPPVRTGCLAGLRACLHQNPLPGLSWGQGEGLALGQCDMKKDNFFSVPFLEVCLVFLHFYTLSPGTGTGIAL